ncbi:cysteine desulfurase family protein [Tenacibaculum aiptasiae]|uniref:cysteine desulfurase family protein n=1 Tax=Tenacibaculum aiptasiae TaxID=426481 RepID=UPI00232A9700|nr:cysteine desulfurase family protein [Tenacibaculum aiptasiae]
MKNVYLDNAATTPMLPEVVEVMKQSMIDNFGNPSSTHQFGRKAKAAVETARKNIAKQFNVSSSEIYFTAGGTEADNLVLYNAVLNIGVTRIVTSKIEHHAVLHTVQYLQERYDLVLEYINVDEKGNVSLGELEEVLKRSKEKTLVSLMYVNNEIGNLLPVDEVASLCKKYQTYFHSDTVQAIGHYKIDLKKTPIDFIAASAHKFHGPKGVGFVYVKKGILLKSMLHGGDQERGVRSSTENVHAILGMEKALSISCRGIENDKRSVGEVKSYLINELRNHFKDVEFNGESSDMRKSSYTILNVRFPVNEKMLLFNLDLAGVAVSGGSACQSGANKGSHVLSAFLSEEESKKTSVRFSFSKLTTVQDIDFAIEKIKKSLKR